MLNPPLKTPSNKHTLYRPIIGNNCECIQPPYQSPPQMAKPFEMQTGIPDDTHPPPNTFDTDFQILGTTLCARSHEQLIMQAQLQQQLIAQSDTIERMERTMAASIDRLVRRLDRLEQCIAQCCNAGREWEESIRQTHPKKRSSRYRR